MPTVILVSLGVVGVAIYCAVGWRLITKYRGTKEVGFLLLGAGLLVSPALSSLVVGAVGEARWTISDGLTVGYTVALLTGGFRVIQGTFVLLGVLLIGRTRSISTTTSLSQNTTCLGETKAS